MSTFRRSKRRVEGSRSATRSASTPRETSRTEDIHQRSRLRRIAASNVAVIAIRLDQSPDEICWADDVEMAPGGQSLSLVVQRSEKLPTRQLVIGATTASQKRCFTTATIEHQERAGENLRVDARWNEDHDEDFLKPRNLTPRIDATQYKFRYGLEESVLARWESIGVIQRFLVDRVLVCPGCQSIPTLREACAKCRSARFSRDRLMHHFACAYVDRVEACQSHADSRQCPKCRTDRLIVETDFEYIDGPVVCFDCGESGTQPTLSCLCHRCNDRFDPADAFTLDLYGYHVERLDPLDIVTSAQ